MRKTKEIKVQKSISITEDILCNKCGTSCLVKEFKDFPEEDPHKREFYGILEQEVSGGYLSTHLDDMTQYRFSLCEGCIRELFNSFKIPVEVQTDYTPGFVPENEIPSHLEEHNKNMIELEQEYKKRAANRKKK